MKVKVFYINSKTGRTGAPIHPLPRYVYKELLKGNTDYLEKYLRIEVTKWNADNVYMNYQTVSNEILPRNIPYNVIRDRDNELKKVWQPQLDDLARETCRDLGEPFEDKYTGYDIKYSYHSPTWARINISGKRITVGHKFFGLSYEKKRLVIKHEFSHSIMGYTIHTKERRQRLEDAGIPAHIWKEDYQRYKEPVKYEIWCDTCNRRLCSGKRETEMIRSIRNNEYRYYCKICKTKNLRLEEI